VFGGCPKVPCLPPPCDSFCRSPGSGLVFSLPRFFLFFFELAKGPHPSPSFFFVLKVLPPNPNYLIVCNSHLTVFPPLPFMFFFPVTPILNPKYYFFPFDYSRFVFLRWRPTPIRLNPILFSDQFSWNSEFVVCPWFFPSCLSSNSRLLAPVFRPIFSPSSSPMFMHFPSTFYLRHVLPLIPCDFSHLKGCH